MRQHKLGRLTSEPVLQVNPLAHIAIPDCIRRCKYTSAEKFLVEVEDRVDDESLESLRIQEEVQAAAGELPDNFEGFSLDMSASLGLDDGVDGPGSGKPEEAKAKLPTFPEIELSRLSERVKKYKDHGLSRKGKFNAAADRLKEEGCTGHETLNCNRNHTFVMSMAVLSTCFSIVYKLS